MLGFSPVVGGVGLVGVILILGGLVALMRRRGSGRDDADDDDNLDEDASEPWEDEKSSKWTQRGPEREIRPQCGGADVDRRGA